MGKNLLSCANLRNSGVSQNDRFSSDVQYYFHTVDELMDCLPQVPAVVSGLIHSYLPNNLTPREYYTPTYPTEWDFNHNNLYQHTHQTEDVSYW